MMRISTPKIIFCLLLPLLALANTAYAKKLRVVATIKPIHSIISAVAKDILDIELIVDKNASPHHFSLSPSKAKMMYSADLIFLIDPEFETFMKNAVDAKNTNSKFIVLSRTQGMNILTKRYSNIWNIKKQTRETQTKAIKKDSYSLKVTKSPKEGKLPPVDTTKEFKPMKIGGDYHIWLDTDRAITIAMKASLVLSAYAPEYKEKFEKNAIQFLKQINELNTKLKDELMDANKAYIVFHDAYQYLEQQYGLNFAGSILLDHNTPPTPKHIISLKQVIKKHGVKCIFAEPQFNPKIIRVLSESTNTKIATIDAEWGEGVDRVPAYQAYFTMMENLAKSIKNCLSDTSP
jgi:zinc transport system substrate-binding protein